MLGRASPLENPDQENQFLLPRDERSDQQAAIGTAPPNAQSLQEKQISREHCSARRCLYGSHLLSAWGSRMWEFAIGLIMLELGTGSLILVSCFGLLDGLTVTAAGPVAGAYIDRTARLKAASLMYLIQNAAVAISAAASLLALSIQPQTALFWTSVICLIAFGSLSSAGALGSTLSVERDWTKALCSGDSQELAIVNAGMRRIDLLCLIASPILAGLLMTYAGTRAAVLLILAWNIIAWAPELGLLRLAHCSSSALRQETRQREQSNSESPFRLAAAESLRSGVALPALSLSLLYLTVLSFGLLTTAYLKWRGMSEAELAVYRGLGAASGISATFLFPFLHNKLGLARSGMLGIWSQLLCLAFAVLPAILSSYKAVSNIIVTHFLVAGLILSRLGLWLFDLCVNQLLQEELAHDKLGVVSGWQGSLASLFQSTSFLVGILLPDPEQYQWLMAGSWTVVLSAAAIFSVWVLMIRPLTKSHIGALEDNAVEIQPMTLHEENR